MLYLEQNKAVELLPEVEQQQLKAGKLPEDIVLCGDEVACPREAEIVKEQEAAFMPSASSPLSSSLILQMDQYNTSFRQSSYPISKSTGHVGNSETGTSLTNFVLNTGSLSKPPFSIVKHSKMDDVSTPGVHFMKATATKDDVNRTSSRFFHGEFQDAQLDGISPQVERNGLFGPLLKVSPPRSRRVMAKPTRTPCSNRGLLDHSPEERYQTASGKRFSPSDPDRHGSMASKDAMDISWR